MSLLIKVCGLTQQKDVSYAASQGADLLGFVRHLPSPRHCKDLSIALPFYERSVLVQVSEDPTDILKTARQFKFGWIQPYLPSAIREQGISLLRSAGFKIILPWPDRQGEPVMPCDLFAWEPSIETTGVLGGSGQEHVMAFPPPGPFLLAGGLSAQNLLSRLKQIPPSSLVHHQGFDAASRLDLSPGIKDDEKVSAYIRESRRLESISI